MAFHARNILVINFGQLGDVVLGLPALRAIRERFPDAKITVLTGKPGAGIVALSGCADAQIAVDRVALRDGNKLLSIGRIGQLVKDVRGRKFDFIIDLHSLSETNLLGYLSGAPMRLYARRPGRSLDWLANFSPAPPAVKNDPAYHLIDRYLDTLKPLGIENAPREPRIYPPPEAQAEIEKILRRDRAGADAPLIGIAPGAGHPSRRWPLERFAELAQRLSNAGLGVYVDIGPEERPLLPQVRAAFPREALIYDHLKIPALAALLERVSLLVCNDSGAMHLASAVGAPVVALFNRPAPHEFIPLGAHHRLIFSNSLENISVGEAHTAVLECLARPRF